MPSLKEYRDRIASVKSTKKITSAMKMVAASKLKKAQEQAEAGQPYAVAMAEMLARVAAGVSASQLSSKLLVGTGRDDRHLLVVVTSDRGLCGGFNANIIRAASSRISSLKREGKDVKLVCVGKKAVDVFKDDSSVVIEKVFTGISGGKSVSFADTLEVTQFVLDQFDNDAFDVCTLIYNEFRSVMVQKPCLQQLIPFELPKVEAGNSTVGEGEKSPDGKGASPYEFEPVQDEILGSLLPRNLGIQIYKALLDSSAGEQAARMTAMDGATRNASEKIDELTLKYNSARQAQITNELIEIISGAEAV